MNYDFKEARQRQEDWRAFYRQMKRSRLLNPELEFEIKEFIDEIENEITEAHKGINGKMTTVTSSGHPIIQFENLLTPIVPQWASGNNPN